MALEVPREAVAPDPRSEGADCAQATNASRCPQMRFYRMTADMNIEHRLLGEMTDPEGVMLPYAAFVRGRRYHGLTPVTARVYHPGSRRDVTYGEGDMIAMRRGLAERFAERGPDHVQLVPLRIDGDPDDWCIVNVVTLRDCLDLTRSQVVLRARAEAPLQPEEINYGHVRNLHIDPARVDGAHIFRVKHFWQALIISDAVVDVLRRAEAVGAVFRPV